jgi:alpha-D-ribose 1-methylphosphonate 5-triphosphate synthase subunit PhnG
MTNQPGNRDPAQAQRRRWMAVLARADAAAITTQLASCPPLPSWSLLRGPECGLVMVRGRMGGGGAPFNLGEMTVTRCTVRTDLGHIGHAYVAGRNERQAELAAAIDAFMQDASLREVLQQTVIAPLARTQQARREQTAAKAAATRVQFFAMRNMRS